MLACQYLAVYLPPLAHRRSPLGLLLRTTRDSRRCACAAHHLLTLTLMLRRVTSCHGLISQYLTISISRCGVWCVVCAAHHHRHCVLHQPALPDQYKHPSRRHRAAAGRHTRCAIRGQHDAHIHDDHQERRGADGGGTRQLGVGQWFHLLPVHLVLEQQDLQLVKRARPKPADQEHNRRRSL
jgi:hypothetical protein